MPELGRPVSYLALTPSVDVYDSSGERVGTVVRVVADDDLDIFEGVVCDAEAAPGGRGFADSEQIAGMFERGLVLGVAAGELRELPAEPPVVRIEHDELAAPGDGWLQRTWDRLRGRS